MENQNENKPESKVLNINIPLNPPTEVTLIIEDGPDSFGFNVCAMLAWKLYVDETEVDIKNFNTVFAVMNPINKAKIEAMKQSFKDSPKAMEAKKKYQEQKLAHHKAMQTNSDIQSEDTQDETKS